MSKEDLIAELEIRGLPGTGSLPVLQARLTKFEREKEDQNKTLDQVEENSEGSKFSDEESGTVSAVSERGSETATGNKSVEVSSGEDNRGNTGTTPKTVSSCIATQTDASLQADSSDELHDISRRAVRDRDIPRPSGVYVRYLADADRRTRRPNIIRQDGMNLADFNIPGN